MCSAESDVVAKFDIYMLLLAYLPAMELIIFDIRTRATERLEE